MNSAKVALVLVGSNFSERVFGTKYSRMDQVKFFKGCLPQVLLGPFLNTLSHLLFDMNSEKSAYYCFTVKF